jgi:hypothetical protein
MRWQDDRIFPSGFVKFFTFILALFGDADTIYFSEQVVFLENLHGY